MAQEQIQVNHPNLGRFDYVEHLLVELYVANKYNLDGDNCLTSVQDMLVSGGWLVDDSIYNLPHNSVKAYVDQEEDYTLIHLINPRKDNP